VTTLALSANEIAWLGTLAVGLVVAIVVLALLEQLRRTVLEVELAVTRVWTAGKQVAQNTQTTHLLETTRERGGQLLEEVERRRSPAGRG
jgi:hypothetical protein